MRRVRLFAAALFAFSVLIAGCTSGGTAVPEPQSGSSTAVPSSTTPPSSQPSSGGSAATAPTTEGSATTDDPQLDRCDDLGVLPCARLVTRLSLTLAGTSIALTYSSDRAAGRAQDRAPSADAVGLGGWTLSVLDTLDAAGTSMITGTGLLRQVTGVAVGGQTAVADRTGRTVDLFDATGRATAVMDATTGAPLLTFQWGPHGLTSVSDRAGMALTVRRLADGTAVRMDAAQGASTLIGTVNGRIAAVQYPDSSRAAVVTDSAGLITEMVDRAGSATGFSYDENGRLLARTTPAGQVTRYAREVQNGTATVTTTLPAGGTTVDSVTAGGGTTTWSHTDAAGDTSTLAASRDVRTIAASDGTSTTVTLAPDPRWGSDAPLPVRVTSGPYSLGTAVTGGTPGSAGAAVIRKTTVNGQTWTFGYDPDTRTASRTDPAGVTVTAGYDTGGRVVRVLRPGGIPVGYRYDSQGRIAAITVGTDPGARTWSYRYSGHTVTVTDPVGRRQQRDLTATGSLSRLSGPGTADLELGRDANDRVTGFAAGSGGAYQVTWGANGRIAAINAPAGQGGPQFTGFEYDAGGNLSKQFTADTTLTIERDAAGRISSYDAGAGDVAAGYDAAGNLTTLTSNDAVVDQTFAGSVITGSTVTAAGISSEVTRTLDSAGRTAVIGVSGGAAVAYGYDPAGRVTTAGSLTLQRNSKTGLISGQTLGSLTETLQYNQFAEPTAVTVRRAGSLIVQINDQRDDLGRITATSTTAGGKTVRVAYRYDDAGRVTAETSNGETRSYTYDAAGNLTSITAPDGTVTKLGYDGRNALVQRGNTTFRYDGAGRLSAGSSPAGTTSYRYDAIGRLLSVKLPGQPEITYTVDGSGRRVAVGRGGTTIGGFAYLDALRPAAELDAAGKVTKQYVYSGTDTMPSYLIADGVDYLEIPDASGGPGIVLNATTGAVADQVQRTAYGQVVSDTDPGFQALGYAGGIVDDGTSLVHFGARDYDPAAGRWTAPDPLSIGGGSGNLYLYASADPVNRRDPAGTCDYVTVDLNLAGGAGVGVSGSYGVVLTSGGIGIYETGLVGPGVGGGVSIDFGCLENLGNNPPRPDDIGGPTTSGTIGAGVGAGPDLGFSDSGTPTTGGGHVSFGPKVGTSGGGGYTIVGCLIGCDDGTGGGSGDDDNPNADGIPDCPGGSCNDDPSDGGAPPAPTNICDGGDCSDPAGAGGPDAPPGNGARSTGDPHLRTADGVYYDLQAVGEFDWLATDDGGLRVQVRQQPVSGSRTVSVTTAVAVSVNGDRLLVNDPGGYQQPIAVSLAGGPLPSVGIATLPHGGLLIRSRQGVLIMTSHADGTVAPDATDTARIWVRTNPRGLDVNAGLPDSLRGKVHGLAGPYTGSEGASLETRTGKKLSQQDIQDRDVLYRTFGDSWRIQQSDSLFSDLPGKDATAFDDPSFPDRAPAVPASSRAAAEAACKQLQLSAADLAGCILDVAVTGDAGFATTMASASRTVPDAAGGAAAAPGTVSGDISPGATVSGDMTAGGSKQYAFTVPAGTVAYFAATAGCADNKMLWDVRDAGGSPVVGASDVCNDLGRVVFDKAGEYRLQISSSDGGSGPYAVQWLASRPDIQKSLTAGSAATGSIDRPGARDVYLLPVHAGEVAYFAADPACAAPAKGNVYWSVQSPDGGAYVGATASCSDLGRVQFDQAGQYQLVVISADGGTAPYSLTWKASRADAVKPLAEGSTAAGTIDLPGARDVYTMTVTSGTVAYLAAAADCTSPPAGSKGTIYWAVQTPDGSAYVGTAEVCSDLGRVVFDKPGSYQLMVSSADGGTGKYSVSWVQSRPDVIRPLTMGSGAAGSVDRPVRRTSGVSPRRPVAPSRSPQLRAVRRAVFTGRSRRLMVPRSVAHIRSARTSARCRCRRRVITGCRCTGSSSTPAPTNSRPR